MCVCVRERSPKSVSEKMFTKQDSDDFLNNFSLQRTDKSHKFFVRSVCVSSVYCACVHNVIPSNFLLIRREINIY